MGKRKSYDGDFKVKVVLESMQRDTTIEQIRIKYGIAPNLVNKWRNQFKQNAHKAFQIDSNQKKPKQGENPEYLKKVIGDLTVENDILKKALSVWD
jgi:transposase